MNERTGGQILIEQLRRHGVRLIFGVPGESYLAALDALHDVDEPRFVVCRQEGGAAMMADAYGKLTGQPGVAFVTRGPGAANASAGVHIAQQDSTPMVLLVGQVDRGHRERDTFQEVDYGRFLGGMAKWVCEVSDPARLPELTARAFATATAGRPGPVVMVLPEDMLAELAEVDDALPVAAAGAAPGSKALARLRSLLEEAERPLVVLGGGGWNAAACADLGRWLEANGLPAASSFRRQDLLDAGHPCNLGHLGIGPDPALAQRVRDADLLIVLGARLGEATTGGFTLIGAPQPRQRLVHVHPDPQEIGRVYRPDLGVPASMIETAAALAACPPVGTGRWLSWTRDGVAEARRWREPIPNPGPVQLAEIVATVAERVPRDAIVTNGAGNYCIWVNRFYPYAGFRTQLAPASGSMGYGLPAAIAAKLAEPRRTVVAFAGDGCFMMTGQELATAVQHDLAITVIVVDNGMYGTIRMHQERDHPGRVYGTQLRNPGFAALAHAHGALGFTVRRTDEFAPALDEALGSGRTALIHLIVDPEALTPRASLTQIREGALRRAR